MKKLLLSALCLLTVQATIAQEKKDFKVTGKPIVTVFTNYNAGIGKSNKTSGFDLERAYFGYDAKVSNNLSAKVVFDIGTSKVKGSDLERIAYIKNAQITWKAKDFSLDFGLIGLQQFSYQERFWGYRYLAKSFQDQYKFGSSADMGITAKYKFTKWISADFTISNGEGYKKLNVDNRNRYSLGATVEPLKGLSFRAYYDTYTSPSGENLKDQQSLALFAGYKHKCFSVGTEYNKQSNTKFKKGKNLEGYSAYATGKVNSKFSVFGRYDYLNEGSYIFGVEYNPIKQLKLSPNYQAINGTDFIFLSLEFKL